MIAYDPDPVRLRPCRIPGAVANDDRKNDVAESDV